MPRVPYAELTTLQKKGAQKKKSDRQLATAAQRNRAVGSKHILLSHRFFPESIAKGSSGTIASLITQLNLHEPTCTSLIAQPNLHEPTYTSQLAQPTCTSQLARANLHSQLTRANLHEPTCTSQLARANLHEPTCTSQLTRANLHENNLHEISHSQTCTRHLDTKVISYSLKAVRWDRTHPAKMTPSAGIGVVEVQKTADSLRFLICPRDPSAGICVVDVQKQDFVRFPICPRDPLRGFAWSTCNNRTFCDF